MSLNPITSLENAINEHSSAKIIEERLKLAKDQYAALERNVSELEVKVQVLVNDNKSLKLELADKEDQLRKLREKSNQEELRDRPELEETILLFLVQNGSSGIDSIATHIGKSEEATRFQLEELEKARLVRSGRDQHSESYYLIDQGGRRYLQQRGLLR